MPPVAKFLGLILIGLLPNGAAAQLYQPSSESVRDSFARPAPSHARAWVNRTMPEGSSPTPRGGGARPAAYETPASAQGGRLLQPASEPAPRPADAGSARLPLSPPKTPAPIGLEPPSPKNGSTPRKPAPGWTTLVTVGSSLAVVLGLFFVFAWFLHRAAPRGAGVLPGEVVEVLGRAPLASKQNVHLLRCGKKLLLVSATQAGIETLTEITEPEEVDRLAGLCKQVQPGSSTALFRQVFQQYSQAEPTGTRLFGRTTSDDASLAAARLPGQAEETWEGADG